MKELALDLPVPKGGHEVFNARNDLSACHAHEGDTGTNKCSRVDSEERVPVPNSSGTGSTVRES